MSGPKIETKSWNDDTTKILDLIKKLDMMSQFPYKQIKETTSTEDDLKQIREIFQDESNDIISLMISKNTRLLLKLFEKRDIAKDPKEQFYFVRVSHSLVAEISIYVKSLRDIKTTNVDDAIQTDFDKAFNDLMNLIIDSIGKENNELRESIALKNQSWAKWLMNVPVKSMNTFYNGLKKYLVSENDPNNNNQEKIDRVKHLKVVSLALLTADVLKEFTPLLEKLRPM